MAFTYKAIKGHKALADGSFPIYVRITKNREVTRINTDVKVPASHWNDKSTYDKGNWVRVLNPMHEVYNRKIRGLIEKCEKLTTDEMSPDDLKEIINGKPVDKMGFLQFARSQAEVKKSKFAPATYNKYLYESNKFEEFLKSKDLPLEKITYELLQKYESYLLIKGNSQNTASKALRFIRVIINDAIKSRILTYNPFSVLKIVETKVNKERLTIEEIAAIEIKEIPKTRKVYDAKAVFLTQFYCAGARIGDVLTMRFENLIEDRWIYTTRKNKKMASIKLNDKALVILKEYGYGVKEKGFVFPFMKEMEYSKVSIHREISTKTAHINALLKELAALIELKKTLTTHIARHSFADILRQKTNDVYAISKALGHSSVSMTERYINSLDQGAVDKTMDIMNTL